MLYYCILGHKIFVSLFKEGIQLFASLKLLNKNLAECANFHIRLMNLSDD